MRGRGGGRWEGGREEEREGEVGGREVEGGRVEGDREVRGREVRGRGGGRREGDMRTRIKSFIFLERTLIVCLSPSGATTVYSLIVYNLSNNFFNVYSCVVYKVTVTLYFRF